MKADDFDPWACKRGNWLGAREDGYEITGSAVSQAFRPTPKEPSDNLLRGTVVRIFAGLKSAFFLGQGKPRNAVPIWRECGQGYKSQVTPLRKTKEGSIEAKVFNRKIELMKYLLMVVAELSHKDYRGSDRMSILGRLKEEGVRDDSGWLATGSNILRRMYCLDYMHSSPNPHWEIDYVLDATQQMTRFLPCAGYKPIPDGDYKAENGELYGDLPAWCNDFALGDWPSVKNALNRFDKLVSKSQSQQALVQKSSGRKEPCQGEEDESDSEPSAEVKKEAQAKKNADQSKRDSTLEKDDTLHGAQYAFDLWAKARKAGVFHVYATDVGRREAESKRGRPY